MLLTYFRCLSTGLITEEERQDYADQLRDVRDSLQAIGFSKDVSVFSAFFSSLLLLFINSTMAKKPTIFKFSRNVNFTVFVSNFSSTKIESPKIYYGNHNAQDLIMNDPQK